jgi:hypothetical protein
MSDPGLIFACQFVALVGGIVDKMTAMINMIRAQLRLRRSKAKAFMCLVISISRV